MLPNLQELLTRYRYAILVWAAQEGKTYQEAENKLAEIWPYDQVLIQAPADQSYLDAAEAIEEKIIANQDDYYNQLDDDLSDLDVNLDAEPLEIQAVASAGASESEVGGTSASESESESSASDSSDCESDDATFTVGARF